MSAFAGPLRQVGLVVRDMAAAIEHWAGVLGVGPFLVMPELAFENYRYRGLEMPGPVVTLAFAQSGPLQIELIQQHDTCPSAYLEFLSAGQEGVQHLCAWPDSPRDYAERREALLARGLVIVHEGATRGSDLRFCYFGTEDGRAAPLLEISEGNLPAMRPLWQRLREASEAWDGQAYTIPLDRLMA